MISFEEPHELEQSWYSDTEVAFAGALGVIGWNIGDYEAQGTWREEPLP